jgi:hypothetical protein
VVSDVSVDDETLIVTSGNSRFASASAQCFRGAHKGRVCVRVFMSECDCVLRASALHCVILKKTESCNNISKVYSTKALLQVTFLRIITPITHNYRSKQRNTISVSCTKKEVYITWEKRQFKISAC